MKKIVFIEAAQNFGGARKAVITMAQVLKIYNKVEIVDIAGTCEPFVEACRDSDLPFKILMPEDNPHYVRSSHSKEEKVKNLISFIPYLKRLNKLIREEVKDADFVCFTGFRPMMSFIFGKPKAKVVFFAHGWYISQLLPRLDRFLLKKYADIIVCISQATRQALYCSKVAPLENMHVVHNSIEFSSMQGPVASIENSEGKFIILLCGGFTKGKGQMIAVEIAKELKHRGFPFKLVLAGIIYKQKESRLYYEQVCSSIIELGLDNEVEIVLNHHNVYDYMRACDVLIHPSTNEGFPLALMEAEILGKPIIANAVGGVIDIVLDGYTGFLPAYNNIKEYADCIIKLHDDKGLYKTISQNAFNLAKDCFSPEYQAKELSRVFNE